MLFQTRAYGSDSVRAFGGNPRRPPLQPNASKIEKQVLFIKNFRHILDQEAHGLTGKLQRLSLDQRRRILSAACQLASQTVGGVEPRFQELVKAAERGVLSQAQITEARLLADLADEQYFTLQNNGAAEAEWLSWFSKARLLTAIAAGFGGDSWSDTADAVYELCRIRDDPSEILNLIESLL